jgi:hypothetical protein
MSLFISDHQAATVTHDHGPVTGRFIVFVGQRVSLVLRLLQAPFPNGSDTCFLLPGQTPA